MDKRQVPSYAQYMRIPVLTIITLLLTLSCGSIEYNRSSDPGYTKARELYDRSVKTGNAEEKYELRMEVIRISPESEYGIFAKAWLSEKQGSYKAALSLYNRAIVMNDREHIFFYNRALLFMKHYTITGTAESLASAEEDLNRCISLDPSYANAYFSRAEIRSGRNDFTAAIADYSVVIKYNPADQEAYYNRGLVKLKIKDYRGVLKDADSAVKCDPEYAAAYCLRGIAFYHLGRKKEACSDYGKAGSIDPDSCIFGGEDGITGNCGE